MSATLRRPLAEMEAIALALVEELRPYCERCEIAGSIRRKKAEVGDVELVCVPRRRLITPPGELLPAMADLLTSYCFGQMEPSGPWLHRRDKNGRSAFGERFKRVLINGNAARLPWVAADIFSVIEPAQWGVVFAIRTGPADFSRKLVTQRYKGGWLANKLRVEDGAVWDGDRIVPCPTEEDFFRCCDRPWVAPEERG